MYRYELSEFGKEIKLELMLQNKTQEWLIERLREQTGMYIDRSNLYKLTRGRMKSPKIENAIRAVLGIQEVRK